MEATIAGGFSDPVDAAQRQFRAVLEAVSAPGRIVELTGDLPSAPMPLADAAYAVALTLLDYETSVWLDAGLHHDAVIASLRFHTGCPLAPEPGGAAFAFAAEPATLPPLTCFARGEPDYPDRSTTLILQVDRLTSERQVLLRGPGIRDSATIAAAGIAADFWRELADDHRQFPLGVDLVLVADRCLAAIPRSTILEVP